MIKLNWSYYNTNYRASYYVVKPGMDYDVRKALDLYLDMEEENNLCISVYTDLWHRIYD